MEKIKVAVLFGGQSTEHAVSLQSACAVLHAMKGTRFEAVPVGITREGRWFWYRGPLDAVGEGVWEKEECAPVTLTPDASVHGLLVQGAGSLYLDAAFPVLHGKNGEDGTVQGLLALAGIPCVGCGVLASALCMDKDAAHRLARAAGVEVPPCVVLHAPPRPEVLAACTHGLRYPLFVKPACAGSSFGVTRVETPDALPAAVAEAFRHDGKVLVEQAVPGFEVGCAVLGAGEALTVGEVDEIELAHGFFDYTEKYTLETARIHMPARLSLAERDRVREAAKTVYRALCCTGFARVDLFYTPDGRIVFNEVNTIPGFTEHSRFPGMMRGAGVEFGPLVERLLDQVTGEGADIDDFLVITYTRAAAAELRARIAQELSDRLAERPNDRHLRRQTTLVYKAQISTVHAFCAALLRESGHQIGLDPDFRLCDEGEGAVLMARVLGETLDRQYEDLDSEGDFAALVDTMAAGRDDSRLEQIVLDVFGRIQSHPDPAGWLADQSRLWELDGVTDAGDTPWGALLLADARRQGERCLELLLRAMELTGRDSVLSQNYGPSLSQSIQGVRACQWSSQRRGGKRAWRTWRRRSG